MKKESILRWSFFLFGLLVLAFGIALTIKGRILGIGPWDVFHYGLFLQLGLSIGSWSIIVGFILLFISFIITKSLPKIGAFLNMLLLGLFIDFFNWLLPNTDSMLAAMTLFVLGVIILGYGIGLYVSADFGAGPRDSIMLVIVEKTGWSIQSVRNAIEIVVFLLGWALGGPVGIGTVLIAFGLGPIIGKSIPQCKTLLAFLIRKISAQDKTPSHI
ncbi:YitT family protein [Bacillus sp. HMF5848]|uniref:YczE/YyaS/YitT family protein n=1 Tax=Bacillus sp. HMF5848 TaxID=2495421 RepID=UPI000F786475|nr:YitT family protein [Bacillus sp. HMF5848]RSK25726.1 YitT family protein [Bacillus sp. HMF5848]